MEELQRRFDELLSVLAIVGPDRATAEALHPPELFAALLQGEFDATSHPHLSEQQMQLSLHLHPPGAPPARLHLRLPPAYPGAAAPLVAAVTCDGLCRQWGQQVVQELQQLAAEAQEECVYQLVEALLGMLSQQGGQHDHLQPAAAQQAQQAQQRQAQQRQGQQQGAPCEAAGRQLALLRLDHMRRRGSYSRLLRRWAGELGLAGRLLLCGATAPIILILLEGPDSGLKEFLLRMRTRNVDIDSKGRPCRERMMTVLARANCCAAAQECSSSEAADGRDGGVAPGGGRIRSPACACGGTRLSGEGERLFASFAEEEVEVAQLAARLRAAGMLQHWDAATGLPPPA